MDSASGGGFGRYPRGIGAPHQGKRRGDAAFGQSGYDAANLNICENLYGQANAETKPHFAYNHTAKVVTGESCTTGSSSVSGLAFYKGGPYPDEYDDALFFADYSRNCIWVMQQGSNGLPNPGQLRTFVDGAAGPVNLQIGPNGDHFYVDLDGGTIRRIRHTSANHPPVARATANPTSGAAPLTVSFDGTGSSDPEGSTLTYRWDLDSDGAFDDSTSSQPSYTYNSAGDYQVGLRVTDGGGASDTLDQPLGISAGNTAPTATIHSPLSTTWKVGDNISFSGSATDQQEGSLGASSLTWSLIMHHCSSQNSCHEHVVQDFAGVASGSFVAPDHEYPSYLELRLTATDSGGLTDTESVRLDPKTVELSFRSDPAGLQLSVGSASATTPFSRTVIAGSKNSISAPSPQTLGGTTYGFASWSDRGAQSHDIVAPDAAATYTATYTATSAACTISGTSGDDTLKGTSRRNDVICGLGGDDTLKGVGGDDKLLGGDGNDILVGGAGNDSLDGAAGTDRASFAGTGAVSASLATNSATGVGSDTLTAIEDLTGSSAADTLIGDSGPNKLGGLDGNDTESGGGGNDNVVGGGGTTTSTGRKATIRSTPGMGWWATTSSTGGMARIRR